MSEIDTLRSKLEEPPYEETAQDRHAALSFFGKGMSTAVGGAR